MNECMRGNVSIFFSFAGEEGIRVVFGFDGFCLVDSDLWLSTG